jgi:hypothetical protein
VIPSARFSVSLIDSSPDSATKKLSLDLMKFVPQGQVEFLHIEDTLEVPEELFTAMPKLTSLYLGNAKLSVGFLQPNPNGPHAGKKLLPSLRSLNLMDVIVEDDNWQPLIDYLSQNCFHEYLWLHLSLESAMPTEVEKELCGLVKYFVCRVEGRSETGNGRDVKSDDGDVGGDVHIK